jgi:methylenetetrahydrofolate--tRNA-(uracil-5-)-methyltransferase
MSKKTPSVAVIGAGLAGSEAALVLAGLGIRVALYEARPVKMTPAHKTDLPAELVCSNSLKAKDLPSAHALLKAELSLLKSPLLTAARECAVEAGGALAVDRLKYSQKVNQFITSHPLIEFIRQELDSPPEGHDYCIIAAGPLVSERLASWLVNEFSSSALNFYDAIAPIIDAESIDRSVAFYASRRDKGTADYLNCPFTEEEYRAFYDALREADRTVAREFEQERFFEACLPIEVAAQRGYQALAFGPLKPVGLIDPRTGKRPFAVCQLRKENLSGTSYNMVGFQTRLTIAAQSRVFRMIPGLGNAEFLRYGSIHRNSYLDSPRLLSQDLSFKKHPRLFLAGQICGNEGYTESIATGHLAALFVFSRIKEKNLSSPPLTSATGALLNHVTASPVLPFTPSNAHFGLFPPLEEKRRVGKKERKEFFCKRALLDFENWLQTLL